jgi:hypothetical protein
MDGASAPFECPFYSTLVGFSSLLTENFDPGEQLTMPDPRLQEEEADVTAFQEPNTESIQEPNTESIQEPNTENAQEPNTGN